MQDEREHPTDNMRRRWPKAAYLVLLGFVMFAAPSQGFAQDPPPPPPPDPQGAPPDPPKKPGTKQNQDSATKNDPDQPTWDPLRAERDMQVGIYYMHKGDIDAAIDRFEDATLAKPGYALPFRYLGEAQEKKGAKKQAIKSYQRYLDLFPKAEDKDKIQKKIDKLNKEVENERK
jgi:tetratricopeptide (TPR) repeat protein